LFFFSDRKSSETKRKKYRLTIHDNAPFASGRRRRRLGGVGGRGAGCVGGGGDCFYRGRERVVASARAVC